MDVETQPLQHNMGPESYQEQSKLQSKTELHQHRSLIAKELLSVLGKSLCFPHASTRFSAFPTWMNCVAHRPDSGFVQDAT